MFLKDPVNANAPRREAVFITSESLKMVVVSASAMEYYYTDSNDARMLEYAHLDMEFVHMKAEILTAMQQSW